jgi:hypothetical protein
VATAAVVMAVEAIARAPLLEPQSSAPAVDSKLPFPLNRVGTGRYFAATVSKHKRLPEAAEDADAEMTAEADAAADTK